MECKYCEKTCKNHNSLVNHERLCSNNPNKQILKSNLINYNAKRKELGIRGSNHFIKAEKLGLEKPTVSEQTKKKISEARRRRKISDETRQKLSESMKMAVQKSPESYTKNNVCGRVKIVEYKGIKLKGSWEVIVAEWLDDNNIVWEHETKCFDYVWNGNRKYYPDFYLPDYDVYIEVKGYETERDLEKWKNVPNLVVFKLNEINKIKNKVFGPLSALAHNESKP